MAITGICRRRQLCTDGWHRASMWYIRARGGERPWRPCLTSFWCLWRNIKVIKSQLPPIPQSSSPFPNFYKMTLNISISLKIKGLFILLFFFIFKIKLALMQSVKVHHWAEKEMSEGTVCFSHGKGSELDSRRQHTPSCPAINQQINNF